MKPFLASAVLAVSMLLVACTVGALPVAAAQSCVVVDTDFDIGLKHAFVDVPTN